VNRGWLSELSVRTALVCASVGGGLVIGEIAVRGLFGDRIVLFPRYHTDAAYGEFGIRTIRPNSTFWHSSVDGQWRFVTNAAGFRDERDFSYEKSRDTIRIVSLGDSHTQGFEVAQGATYSAILEQELDRTGIESDVINTGVSGFGTAEQLVLLENEMFKYDPDIVVLGFYANDFKDNVKSGLFAIEDGRLELVKTSHLPGVRIQNLIYQFDIVRWLSENSYLYSWAFNATWDLAKNLLLTRRRAELTREYAILTEKVAEYERELTAALLQRMYQFCRRHDIGFVVVDIPQPSTDGRLRTSLPPAIRDAVRKSSDAVLFAEEIFDGHPPGALHVPNGHRHISERAHGVLASELARAVQQLLETRRGTPPPTGWSAGTSAASDRRWRE